MTKAEFLAILEPLEPKLFGFAYRMLRHEDQVRDAMQELMLKLWKNRKKLDQNQNISAYCLKALHHICIDTLRHQGRYVAESSLADGENKSLSQRVPALNEDLANDQHELIETIRKAVDQLPTKQKAIIELHDFQDFSHAEIAETLGLEINAVRTNLSRARAKIKAQFKKEEVYG